MSLPFRVKLLWFRPQVCSAVYVVCWYVHTDAFPELHTADLAVLAAVPQETAEGVVIMQTVSDTAAHSRHWDGHHQCGE